MQSHVIALLALIALVHGVSATFNLTPDSAWNTLSYGAVGAASPSMTVTLAAPGFIDVTDCYCAGDQFDVIIDGKSAGKTSVPIASDGCLTATNKPATAAADSRWSSGRYYVAAGQHTVSLLPALSPMSSGSAFVRATPGVCQGPPSTPQDVFAMVADAKCSSANAVSKCTQYGLDPAQITTANLPLAISTAKNCQALLGATTIDPVWIRSWNGQSYPGATMALFSAANSGTVNVASGDQYTLCQKKATIDTTASSDCQIISQSDDKKMFLVGPPVLQSEVGAACANFNAAVPAVLADTTSMQTAATMVFQNVGPNSNAWCGGSSATKPMNGPYAVTVGADSKTVNVNSDLIGQVRLNAVCALPTSVAGRAKRSVEDL